MRWPWEPPSGMVRINQRRLLELRRNALLARDLEAEIRKHRNDRALSTAKAYVLRLAPLLTKEEQAAAEVVALSPPLTAEGDLHKAALEALVDASVWAIREAAIEQLSNAEQNES